MIPLASNSDISAVSAAASSDSNFESDDEFFEDGLQALIPRHPVKEQFCSSMVGHALNQRKVTEYWKSVCTGIAFKPIQLPEYAFVDPEKGLGYLKRYPVKDLERLLVDGVLLSLEGGCETYESREPGCLRGLINAWTVITENLTQQSFGQPLAIPLSLLIEIHKKVSEHCSDRFHPGIIHSREGGRIYPGVGHADQNIIYCTEAGITEAEEYYQQYTQVNFPNLKAVKRSCFSLWIKSNRGHQEVIHLEFGFTQKLFKAREDTQELTDLLSGYFHSLPESQSEQEVCFFELFSNIYSPVEKETTVSAGDPSLNTSPIYLNPELLSLLAQEIKNNFATMVRLASPAGEVIEDAVKQELRTLEKSLPSCKNKDEFFKLLCSGIRHLQQIHPFSSANGRTITLLLQYILMGYGFPPATLLDPNEFYLKTSEDEVLALKDGIACSEKLLYGGLQETHCSKIHGHEISRIGTVSQYFKSKLESLFFKLNQCGQNELALQCTDAEVTK